MSEEDDYSDAEKYLCLRLASSAWIIVILHLKLLHFLLSPSKVFEGSLARKEATLPKFILVAQEE